MADGLREKLEDVRAKLAGLKSTPPPNEPIPEFPILDEAFLREWDARLQSISEQNLIEEVTTFLEEVELPTLDSSEPRHDHLRIYHQVSQLREAIRAILSEAIALGYPHDLNIVARTNEIAPDLRDIATSLERIETRIGVIQGQATSIGDGISISLGPISISLNALKQSANAARQKIQLNRESTNVSALLLALSKTANIANEIGRQINSLVRDIPRRLRTALNEVVQLANQAADKGIELLRSIRAQKRSEPVQSPAEVLAARKNLEEVAHTLRELRKSRGIELLEAARYLKIHSHHMKAIDEGRFGDLPGRTYAIGWIQAYTEYLNLSPHEAESLLMTLRQHLPGSWFKDPLIG